MVPLDGFARVAQPRLVLDESDNSELATPTSTVPLHDGRLLDDYSAAVSGAVERTSPAVAHLRVERAARCGAQREGSGSGFILTPAGYLGTTSPVASRANALALTLPH